MDTPSIKDVFARLGGLEATRSKLLAKVAPFRAEPRLSYKGVWWWADRNFVAARWHVPLLLVCRDEGIELDPLTLIADPPGFRRAEPAHGEAEGVRTSSGASTAGLAA